MNTAWNSVKSKCSPSKGGLNKIHEEDEENSQREENSDSSSSFEASNSPSP